MKPDPIVEETRTVRDEYARSLAYDIERITDDLQQRERARVHRPADDKDGEHRAAKPAA